MQTFELLDFERDQLLELLREKLHSEETLAHSMPADSTFHGYRARMCIRFLEILKPRDAARADTPGHSYLPASSLEKSPASTPSPLIA
jgi:hypothetical protein